MARGLASAQSLGQRQRALEAQRPRCRAAITVTQVFIRGGHPQSSGPSRSLPLCPSLSTLPPPALRQEEAESTLLGRTERCSTIFWRASAESNYYYYSLYCVVQSPEVFFEE
eukprot:scaffold259619_cov41-Tisochrysis_lutea.AAC.2